MSEEIYAASSEPINDHIQVKECSAVETENHITKDVCINEEIEDDDKNNPSGETCDCSPEDNKKLSELRTTNETEPLSNPSSGMKSEIAQDSSESLSQRDRKTNKDYEHHGARPKVVDKSKNQQGSSNAHLSNKKRKELAKQEKKKRREERRKDESNSHLESSVAGLENLSGGVVADLGLLAI